MEIQTEQTEEGTEITVYTDRKVALAVRSGEEERIYLPDVEADESTYYTGSPTGLTRFSDGYRVTHSGEIDDLQVIA